MNTLQLTLIFINLKYKQKLYNFPKELELKLMKLDRCYIADLSVYHHHCCSVPSYPPRVPGLDPNPGSNLRQAAELTT